MFLTAISFFIFMTPLARAQGQEAELDLKYDAQTSALPSNKLQLRLVPVNGGKAKHYCVYKTKKSTAAGSNEVGSNELEIVTPQSMSPFALAYGADSFVQNVGIGFTFAGIARVMAEGSWQWSERIRQELETKIAILQNNEPFPQAVELEMGAFLQKYKFDAQKAAKLYLKRLENLEKTIALYELNSVPQDIIDYYEYFTGNQWGEKVSREKKDFLRLVSEGGKSEMSKFAVTEYARKLYQSELALKLKTTNIFSEGLSPKIQDPKIRNAINVTLILAGASALTVAFIKRFQDTKEIFSHSGPANMAMDKRYASSWKHFSENPWNFIFSPHSIPCPEASSFEPAPTF